MQYVFSSFYECEGKHVGRSHDGGVDLIMINSDKPILILVKRRTNKNHTESVKSFKEFVGTLTHKMSSNGIYVSTANLILLIL